MSFTFELVNKVAELRAELASERAKNATLQDERDELSRMWQTCYNLLTERFQLHCLSIQAPGFAAGKYDDLKTALAAEQEKTAKLEKELEEVIAVLRKECDHEWQHEDDSFDHEFGTEQLHSSVCEKCGLTKPYEPETFGDEAI